MDIITYLLSLIQSLYQQNCWLVSFICRYIPIKQWAFDDSHSPKYQKFKIDELSLVTNFHQEWTYKELIPYYQKRYGKKIRLVSRRSDYDISDDSPAHAVMPQSPSFTKTTTPKVSSCVRSAPPGSLLPKAASPP